MEGGGHIHAPTNSRLKTQPPANFEYEIGWVLMRSGRCRENQNSAGSGIKISRLFGS
jgi:hypothetical protein